MQTPPVSSVPSEQDELRQLALIADAFSGLTHALNNHLNGMVLQAAALQLRLPPEFREPLDRIRREGSQAANLFRPLQVLRQKTRQAFQTVEVGGIIRTVLTEKSLGGWTLSPTSLPIPATVNTLRRMFQYLLPALEEFRHTDNAGTITLQADPSSAIALRFRLIDSDAKAQVARLAEIEEHNLSMAFLAVRSILRLLEGKIEVVFIEPDSAEVQLTW